MSSGANPVGGGSSAPTQYFCYQCDRTVNISPTPSSDLVCPTCNGGFLEEIENPNPNPIPNPFFAASSDYPFSFPSLDFGSRNISPSTDPFSAFFSALHSGDGGIPVSGDRDRVMDANDFDPLIFLQNYLQSLRASGANIQFVIENSSGGGEPGRNWGDYFVGPGLEQLIQQLAENDPNRYGTPPASKEAVSKLPDIKIDEELLKSDSSQCAVCKDTFEFDTVAKLMPCKHIYHNDCILPWLELHNSCPVCRYELPTDDPDYENRVRNGGNNNNNNNNGGNSNASNVAGVNVDLGFGSGGSGGGDPQTPRSGERRFRVALPWPFNAFGASSSETGNSGNRGNNSGGSGNSGGGAGGNSGSQGGGENREFGSETRQEDLD